TDRQNRQGTGHGGGFAPVGNSFVVSTQAIVQIAQQSVIAQIALDFQAAQQVMLALPPQLAGQAQMAQGGQQNRIIGVATQPLFGLGQTTADIFRWALGVGFQQAAVKAGSNGWFQNTTGVFVIAFTLLNQGSFQRYAGQDFLFRFQIRPQGLELLNTPGTQASGSSKFNVTQR